MTGLVLALVGLLLVGPGPLMVVRWAFLHQVPRAAVLLWQAGTVAGLIAVIGAGVLLSVPLLRDQRPRSLWQLSLTLVAIFTVVVVGRLIWSTISVIADTGARRSRHRLAVDLLGQVEPKNPQRGLRILAQAAPLAYCLPGVRKPRVVLSSGTLQRLRPDELAAVLAHENAHLAARHDVVLDTFTALQRAFPLAVRSEIPLRQCRLLVELLADDAARQATGPVPLARALVAMAGCSTPTAVLGIGEGVAERIQRLSRGQPPRWLAPLVYLLALSLVLLPIAILVFAAPA